MQNLITSVNKIIISGTLTKDPDQKVYGDSRICRLQIASTHSFINKKTGSPGREVCYIDIDAWGPLATFISQTPSICNGSTILVEGKLKLNSWKDAATQQKRTRHTITAELITPLESNRQPQVEERSVSANTIKIQADPATVTAQEFIDELPF